MRGRRESVPASGLRQRLLGGRKVQGAFLFLTSPDAAEIMALAGYGALIVDREHAAADHADALHELRAIHSVSDTPALIRVRDTAVSAIKPMLDAGFDGILVADVRSAADARKVAEVAHYPPLGRRGAQFTVSRAAAYGEEREGYVQRARDETLVIAMIESRAGIEAIEDIAAVSGIDMLFLGPLDLSSDYGAYGDLASAELQAAIAIAEKKILASGRLLGGAAIKAEDLPAMFARGYSFVTSASDVALLARAARKSVHQER